MPVPPRPAANFTGFGWDYIFDWTILKRVVNTNSGASSRGATREDAPQAPEDAAVPEQAAAAAGGAANPAVSGWCAGPSATPATATAAADGARRRLLGGSGGGVGPSGATGLAPPVQAGLQPPPTQPYGAGASRY